MKKIFIQGLMAGVIAAFTSMLYFYLYQSALHTRFDKIINPGAIFGSSVFGSVLISIGYMLIQKLKLPKLKGIYNLLLIVLSFASIIGPIGISLPLDIKTPELFPGLAIPMHFFPALVYFAIEPFFGTSETTSLIK
jgi:hypothetical protein